MSFLRHDKPVPSEDAVLFDYEGGSHVKGRSTRVSQQPGGNSSLSLGFGGGEKENTRPSRGHEPVKVTDHHRGSVNRMHEIPPAPVPAPAQSRHHHHDIPPAPVPARQEQHQDTHFQNAQNAQGSAYTALYCNEGSQVRTRPARKVVQPPGGASSISF